MILITSINPTTAEQFQQLMTEHASKGLIVMELAALIEKANSPENYKAKYQARHRGLDKRENHISYTLEGLFEFYRKSQDAEMALVLATIHMHTYQNRLLNSASTSPMTEASPTEASPTNSDSDETAATSKPAKKLKTSDEAFWDEFGDFSVFDHVKPVTHQFVSIWEMMDQIAAHQPNPLQDDNRPHFPWSLLK